MRRPVSLALVLLTTNCWAQENGQFNSLIGVWAHTSAACRDYTSGKVDRLPDRASKTTYELVGICANGIELLYQPVGCQTKASNIPGISRVDVRSRLGCFPPLKREVGIRSTSEKRSCAASNGRGSTPSRSCATPYATPRSRTSCRPVWTFRP